MPATEPPWHRSPWPVFAVTSAIVLVADALTKATATRFLGPDQDRQHVEIIPSVLDLDYSQNTGIAFGLLRDNSIAVWFLVALAAVGVAAVVWTSKGAATPLKSIALGMVAGGGLANIANRAIEGHVVDFIAVSRWPSFNIADASLTVGVILLAVLHLSDSAAGNH